MMIKKRHAFIVALVFSLTTALFVLSQEYGISGAPTKDTTIVNHATKLIRPAINHTIKPSGGWSSDRIPIDGYAKVSILVYLSESDNSIGVFACNYDDEKVWLVESVYDIPFAWVKTYDVMNQQIMIQVFNSSYNNCTIWVDVYLMA